MVLGDLQKNSKFFGVILDDSQWFGKNLNLFWTILNDSQ